MDKIKVILPILIIGLTWYFLKSSNEKDLELVENKPIVKKTINKAPKTVEEEPEEEEPKVVKKEVKKVEETSDFKKKKVEIEDKVKTVLNKIEVCRKKVENVISEQEIGELESELWSQLSNKMSGEKSGGIDQKQLDFLNEKIVELTSVPWHLNELTGVTSELMQTDVAMKDPKWTLEQGGKLVPCGIYQTHRIFSLWSDLVEDKSKLKAYSPEYVESFTIGYVKRILNNQLGSSGVSMQLELLVNLAQKGYFPKDLRDKITEFDENLNLELESMALGGNDDEESSLIQAISKDYSQGERIRKDFIDIIQQFYPDE